MFTSTNGNFDLLILPREAAVYGMRMVHGRLRPGSRGDEVYTIVGSLSVDHILIGLPG